MKEMSNLPGAVVAEIQNLLERTDLAALYKDYVWKNDRWENGFPEIRNLERIVGAAIRAGTLSRSHLVAVAKWGRLPNIGRIWVKDQIKCSIYENGKIAPWIKSEPENAIRILEGQIRGFGPTYNSKVLRFAAPDAFGAIDTWIVRVFGKNGQSSHHCNLLDLHATPIDGRWAILASQIGWPGEYGTWIKVLTYISKKLRDDGILCPHPHQFEDLGLRSDGEWFNADIEMALFNYATRTIKLMRG